MALYTVKNEALGARGVGSVLIEALSVAEVELTEDEARLLGGLDGVTVSGVSTSKPDPLDHDGDGRKGGSRPRATKE